MVVYRVVGHTGEYEDRIEWTAGIFANRDKALAFVEECTNFVNSMMDDELDEDEGYEVPKYYNLPKYLKDSPDINVSIDYTGTWYTIEELEVIE